MQMSFFYSFTAMAYSQRRFMLLNLFVIADKNDKFYDLKVNSQTQCYVDYGINHEQFLGLTKQYIKKAMTKY